MSLSRGAVRLCEVQEETSISSAWSSVAAPLVCLFSWLLWLVGMSSRCATHHAQVLLMCDQCGSGVSREMLIWNRDTRHIPPPLGVDLDLWGNTQLVVGVFWEGNLRLPARPAQPDQPRESPSAFPWSAPVRCCT